ncbi:MAG: TetR family transcriptional regulator, partial [Acidobacteriota bacterium]|nr:TetR family transcriptional regulator [Acidobacteriota bacterium]
MNVHSPNAPATAPGSRAERRWRTRRALLDAALELQEDGGFASLSMSGVARRAGIVPSAFYRHFAGMEELGVALIDESFGTLRTMLSAARADPRTYEHVVGRSVEILARYVREHRAHFRFIGRERSGGVAVLRDAIRREIRAFASDLATDLARFPELAHWSSEDLRLLAGIFVNVMV